MKLNSEDAVHLRKKRLKKAEKRIKELDQMFIRLYEDNAKGRISDECFSLMSKTYEDKQAQLKTEAETLRQEIKVQAQSEVDGEGAKILRIAGIDSLCPAGTGERLLH